MTDNPKSPPRVSSYLQYLPALQQSDEFLGRFLLALEQILSGLTPREPEDPIPEQPGLEQYVDRIDRYFNPAEAPADFLPWLATWVAASLEEEWNEDFKRQFIANIVPLYRLRGTKAGVKKLLELYTKEQVTIYEFDSPPHYFQVEIILNEVNLEKLRREQQIAMRILDLQKPAHTFYGLQVLIPAMQIRNKDLKNGIVVGRTTILGTITQSA